ncbi:MAG: YdiU family protein [Rhodobacteraceae bacterium]|nr:YdiU family protein [Paracoccaceae bacterium]
MTQTASRPAPASIQIAFDNSYARLPPHLFARVDPVPAPAPRLIAWNAALARDLGLPEAPEDARAAVFSGSALPEGAEPLAMAYAGHQFGGFVPQLGDGRAHLLGEVIARDGTRMDIQLKGSGRTPFSRGGDGLAWIGPVLREYLVSEAMAAMGVPTTRALAAVATGAPVWREQGQLPGAVLTRVAQSHIRVGTFQYFAARRDVPALQALLDHAAARHFPQAEGAAGFLRAVVAAQAELVAQWMALGFIHGVMNTDNCHVGGLTIDYGPCAFMDAYHPDTVFSSIDRFGRYAYANQPQIAVWNLAQLATCLLPLMPKDQDAAIAEATEIVHGFAPLYETAHGTRFAAKLGLADWRAGDEALLQALLDRMARLGADFTRVFYGLRTGKAAAEFREPEAFETWAADWRARLDAEGSTQSDAQARMARANPGIIPRNHQVEAAITAAVAGNDVPFHRLHAACTRPFDPAPEDADLMAPPRPEERVQATFCGT